MTHSFDLIVIGGGSGGLAMAKRAAEYGQKVALIEGDRLGGTCVNRGCVPKKVMWYGAHVAETLHHAGAYGFTPYKGDFNWTQLVEKREAYIRRINGSYDSSLGKVNVEVITGWAKLVSKNEVDVNGTIYSAEHIALSTGGKPFVPDIPGADLGIDSDGFFELTEQPKKVAVIGAGYIAVEIAGVMHALGSDVTQVLRKHKPLREFDTDISDHLMEIMSNSGIQWKTQSEPTALIRLDDGSISIETANGSIGTYDSVIWAIGRTPLTEGIGLENAGLSTNAKGFLETNDWQVTAVDNIFALGDMTGRAQLTPVAIAAGRRLADRLYNGMKDRKLDYSLIPTVVFSHPAISTIGLTEEQAIAQYGQDQIRVYRSSFNPMYYMPVEETDKVKTIMKLVVMGENEKVIGCHMIGRDADEMAQGFAVAMRMGATKSDFDDTIAIHPTSAEEFVTMR